MEIIKHPSAVFVISNVTGYPLREIISKTKKKPVSTLRQILCWFLFYEGISIHGITELTRFHRATVAYSIKVIDGLIDVEDKKTLALIEHINEFKERFYDN